MIRQSTIICLSVSAMRTWQPILCVLITFALAFALAFLAGRGLLVSFSLESNALFFLVLPQIVEATHVYIVLWNPQKDMIIVFDAKVFNDVGP